MYLRVAKSGQVFQKFRRIAEPESTRGNNLLLLVQSSLELLKIPKVEEQLVGYGSDGAANMMGKHRGCAKQLKDQYPLIIIVHCLAHRLELAFKDGIKAWVNTLYTKLLTVQVGVYYFYKKGTAQRKGLKMTFKVRVYEYQSLECNFPNLNNTFIHTI